MYVAVLPMTTPAVVELRDREVHAALDQLGGLELEAPPERVEPILPPEAGVRQQAHARHEGLPVAPAGWLAPAAASASLAA